MPSLAVTTPVYNTPSNYNALDGYSNFNASASDSLTDRAAKLTAMMADRVQDRSAQIIGRVGFRNITNGTNQDIVASSNPTLIKHGSPSQEIDFGAPISLAENTALIIELDRDGSATITPTVESLGSQFILEENKYILFYRLTDQQVHAWNGQSIGAFNGANLDRPEDSQNRNITFFVPGSVGFNSQTGEVNFNVEKTAELTDITAVAGAAVPQSSYFEIYAANNAVEYYVWFNRDGSGTDPNVAGKIGVVVNITSADTQADVQEAIALAVDAQADFSATFNSTTTSILNTDVGPADDAQDGLTATGFSFDIVNQGSDLQPVIIIPGSVNDNEFDPTAITASGFNIPDDHSAWVRINRYGAKTFTNAQTDPTVPDTDMAGSIYVTLTDQVPVDQDVFVLFTRSGQNLMQHHKADQPKGNVYEERVRIVLGAPTNDNEITGPLPSGTQVILPSNQSSPRSQY
jgi:hypothetical protein